MQVAENSTKLSETLSALIPFRGTLFEVQGRLSPFAFSRIYIRDNVLHVNMSSLAGSREKLCDCFADQIDNWLKAQARRFFCEEVERQKNIHGFNYKAVALKDTRSRWGSCTAKGNLNFNWRLVMAPGEILSYVVAHETAHLTHLNHSSDFWNLVKERFPEYLKAKNWLRINGASLMNWKFRIQKPQQNLPL
jgi:predicted metal-dependent hydrolase